MTPSLQTDTAEPDTAALSDIARRSVVPEARRTLILPDGHAAPERPGAGAVSDGDVRFDLYHFGFSICSNKVRAVLCEVGVPWLSLELDAARHENYRPDYVRLRLASQAARDSQLATGWDGGSSVAEAGFDALVAPTLVDRHAHEVVADSLSICKYLAHTETKTKDLLPADLAAEIKAELQTVDRTPHVALLYGANPDGDGRSFMFRRVFGDVHGKKAEAAAREADRVKGEDPRLDAAYAAKIAKEQAGSAFVASPERMRHAIAKADNLIGGFAERLAASDGPWILGARYTLADLFWGVSLFRLEFLGYGWLYRAEPGREAVAAYADRSFARPSIRTAVADWPSHPWSNPAAQWMRRPSVKDRLLGLGSHTPRPNSRPLAA